MVFHNRQQVAVNSPKKVIIYSEVAGHEKGLVNTMSGFGVKTLKWRLLQEVFLQKC